MLYSFKPSPLRLPNGLHCGGRGSGSVPRPANAGERHTQTAVGGRNSHATSAIPSSDEATVQTPS